MNTLLSRLGGTGLPALLSVVVLIAVHPALLVAAAWPSPGWFAAGMVVVLAAEWYAARHARPLLGTLGRAQLNVTTRYLARDLAVLVLAARVAQHDRAMILILTLGLLALHGLRGGMLLLRRYIVSRRTLPVATRNVDLSALRIPDAPPEALMGGGVHRPLLFTLPVIAGVLVDVITGTAVGGPVGLVVALAASVGTAAVLARHAWCVRHLGNRAWVIQTVHRQVLKYRPEVALYHSSGTETAYQVNMWISTLKRLDRRPIILMRERMHLAAITRTDIPIVCVVGGSDLMDFELPDLKVVLYVGNVGKNIHMLRNGRVKHVFVGHGDSDKQASANPFSKVYDEVWVAGRAGRDRYHRARSGVRDSAIVEVGRPQLDEVAPAPETPRPMFTVLYAPTWEGWSNDMYLTSVNELGERFVKALLAYSPAIRVIYKPHPLTGIRNARVRQAHHNIVAMLDAANQRRGAEPQWSALATRTADDRAAARAELNRLTDRLHALRGVDVGDAAQRCRDTGRPDPDAVAEIQRCETQWVDAFWRARGWWSHTVVTGSRPALYSCFNQADMLISDISSVVSDFISSGKPYVVTNQGDVDPVAFRAEQTAAGGAYLLGSKCAELADILAAVYAAPGARPEDAVPAGADPMAQRRREVRTYLLGPDQPDAMTRFGAAVEHLIDRWHQDELGTPAAFTEPTPGAPVPSPLPLPRQSTGRASRDNGTVQAVRPQRRP